MDQHRARMHDIKRFGVKFEILRQVCELEGHGRREDSARTIQFSSPLKTCHMALLPTLPAEERGPRPRSVHREIAPQLGWPCGELIVNR
jgi:hypothetical protein